MYSDIVLPTVTWYEKNDLSSTGMHSYIHTLSEAVPPCWESKTDFDIFKSIAKKFSELAEIHFDKPVKDIVSAPLMHDTPAEMAQVSVKDWYKGECEAIPGKTMPNIVVVERDYANLYNKFISLGPNIKNNGLNAHGISWEVEDFYHELMHNNNYVTWDGNQYPSLETDANMCNAILHLAPETNGESAYRAFKAEEEKTGVPLIHLGERNRSIKYSFEDLQKQPRRVLTSPIWSGNLNDGRTYAAYTINIENHVPWRTLTGRQQFYIDHEGFIAYGENLPTYKPKPSPEIIADLLNSPKDSKSIVLNYITSHGKWQIHSTYFDNLRMLTLSRGIGAVWINDKDANQIEIADNDWVEVYNDHGTVVTRAIVSARIPQDLCIIYHATERTISVPKSPIRNNNRAGGHNSLVRLRVKPTLFMAGYGHLTYSFNYWGPTGVNRDTYVLIRKLEEKPRW